MKLVNKQAVDHSHSISDNVPNMHSSKQIQQEMSQAARSFLGK